MNSSPQISVVIPCHNAERWIADAVTSALHQTDVTVEVIVVDDGSDDSSVDRVASIGDSRIQIIRQQQSGASRARNVGTDRATGEFVQYLDADDALVPATLRLRAGALTATGADVAYCDWVRWQPQRDGSYADGDVVVRRLGARPDVQLLKGEWWPPAALLYRRSIVERIGGWREDLPVIQDARFQIDAALCGAKFVHVPGVGARYRTGTSESLSQRNRRAFLDDCLRNAFSLETNWRREHTFDDERRHAVACVYADVMRGFLTLERAKFLEAAGCLHRVEPFFLPAHPRGLRLLSRLAGYQSAVEMAQRWRQFKELGRV